MTQKATALIKFKHCDFGEHYAEAAAAYDAAESTAWIAPFTIAQRAYWMQQDGGLINGYAEAYAASRSSSINNSAQSAYATCMAGGASSPTSVVEPGFKLVVQTRLDGGSSSGALTSAGTGPSAQLSVPFKPEPALDHALDWRAFYRVGSMQLIYNYAENWVMSYPTGDGYPLPSYTELLMRPTVNVEANNLVSLSADLVQYIDVPQGKTITAPENPTANFIAVQSFFSFVLQRQVVLPDGQVIQEEFEFDNGFRAGELSDVHATVELPGLNAGCDVSGTVDVYHFITAYAFGTLYKLSNKIQQVRVEGVDYDFTIPARAVGSVPPSYGPPGLLSVHESFYYQAVLKLGIVRIKYKQQGVFRYQRMFLVWNGAPFGTESLVGMTSNVASPKFYGKYLTEIFNAYESITLSGGTALHAPNGTYEVPIIEDIVVSNFEEGTLTVSPTSNYVEYSQSIIKIKNVLKPLDVFPLGAFTPIATSAPYGQFVTPQPNYSPYGNFLSVLPNFVDHINWEGMFGVIRIRYTWYSLGLIGIRLFLVWRDGVERSADQFIGLYAEFRDGLNELRYSAAIPPNSNASSYLVDIGSISGYSVGPWVTTLDVPVIGEAEINEYRTLTTSGTSHISSDVVPWLDQTFNYRPKISGVIALRPRPEQSFYVSFYNRLLNNVYIFGSLNKNSYKAFEVIPDFFCYDPHGEYTNFQETDVCVIRDSGI